MPELYSFQKEAIEMLKSGSILCGGVGSGKSITSLGFFFEKECGGKVLDKDLSPMTCPKDLYIITTARKRDTFEWEAECIRYGLPVYSHDQYKTSVKIDSWNNIAKYVDVEGAFFIFDEQRVIGWGTWSKSFVKIAKHNHWILLSATPGDTWSDYIPVFIANGFYRNKTDFVQQHVVYSRFAKFPKVDHYVGTKKLERHRNDILVNMAYEHNVNTHHEKVVCNYDIKTYKDILRTRVDPYTGEPIQDAASMCYLFRRVVNENVSRIHAINEVMKDHKRVIIFYNFDYELEVLRKYASSAGIAFAEWNGHKHEMIPDSDSWIYLVQYTAGAEGWNCISTNCIIFYSQNYSYKIMVQAAGRINRMNTPFEDLYYYHLKSMAPIDIAISRALNAKKSFNERKFVERISS